MIDWNYFSRAASQAACENRRNPDYAMIHPVNQSTLPWESDFITGDIRIHGIQIIFTNHVDPDDIQFTFKTTGYES